MGEGRVIDLDEARAARSEAEPVSLVFLGEEYTLPPELPFEFADAARREEPREAIAVLLGEKAEDFFSKNPSVADIQFLTESIASAYGIDAGKSEPSATS